MATATKTAAKKEAEDLQLELAILRDDIAALKTTIAEYGKAQGSHLRSVANAKVNEAAAYGAARAEDVQKAALKTYADTEDAVRANPAAAVGLAVGAGFLLGMLLSNRS